MDTPNTCALFRNAWQVWKGPLAGDAFVVVVVNRFDTDQDIEMDWSADAHIPEGRYLVRDLWEHAYLGVFDVRPPGGGAKWTGRLEAHANWAFRLERDVTEEVIVQLV